MFPHTSSVAFVDLGPYNRMFMLVEVLLLAEVGRCWAITAMLEFSADRLDIKAEANQSCRLEARGHSIRLSQKS